MQKSKWLSRLFVLLYPLLVLSAGLAVLLWKPHSAPANLTSRPSHNFRVYHPYGKVRGKSRQTSNMANVQVVQGAAVAALTNAGASSKTVSEAAALYQGNTLIGNYKNLNAGTQADTPNGISIGSYYQGSITGVQASSSAPLGTGYYFVCNGQATVLFDVVAPIRNPLVIASGQVRELTSADTLNVPGQIAVAGTNGVSGTSDGITSTGGLVTAVRSPALGIARFADFTGSTSQSLAAGAAWTRYIMDTLTTATTSASLAAQFTLSTSRFIAEAVGKVYLYRMGYSASLSAGGAGYLEFALDPSAAGDGSSIKTVTPVYFSGAALATSSYQFDTTTFQVCRTTASTAAPGAVILVRFVGTGTVTLTSETLAIVDASGVSYN